MRATPTQSRPSKKAQSSAGSTRVSSVDARIRAQMSAAPPGKVFGPTDFSDVGSRAAVDQVLSRLTASGAIRRVTRGLYDVPRHHALLGPLLPTADEIAQALAGKGGMRLQPSGAYAANLLGLTEQVPMKRAFLTDGASRTIQVGNQTIMLKHTTPRNMATAGRISGLVIQALRHLKRQNIDEAMLAHLHARISSNDKDVLLADAAFAPAWIAAIMRTLANKDR